MSRQLTAQANQRQHEVQYEDTGQSAARNTCLGVPLGLARRTALSCARWHAGASRPLRDLRR